MTSTGGSGLSRLLLLLALLFGCVGKVAAEESVVTEEALLKAAYIYNFAKFTRWEGEPEGDTLHLCTLGHNGLGEALQRLAGKWVGERRIAVRLLSQPPAGECHILYFSASQSMHYRTQLHELVRQPLLTVSEIPGFASNGGMIELFEEQGRVRFRVNLKEVEAAGLTLSSRLLNLAEIVAGEGR